PPDRRALAPDRAASRLSLSLTAACMRRLSHRDLPTQLVRPQWGWRERPGRRGRIEGMVRWLTAGESHGRALVAIIEGVPAGVQVSTADIAAALARRRAGHGRGARMKFEQDEVDLTAGVRHGHTLGGPVAVRIANPEWPK